MNRKQALIAMIHGKKIRNKDPKAHLSSKSYMYFDAELNAFMYYEGSRSTTSRCGGVLDPVCGYYIYEGSKCQQIVDKIQRYMELREYQRAGHLDEQESGEYFDLAKELFKFLPTLVTLLTEIHALSDIPTKHKLLEIIEGANNE